MGDRQNNSVWVSAVEKIGAGSLSFYIEGKVELRKLCALGMTVCIHGYETHYPRTLMAEDRMKLKKEFGMYLWIIEGFGNIKTWVTLIIVTLFHLYPWWLPLAMKY